MVKNPHVRLKRVDVVDYKVDHSGNTFKITMGGNGEFLRKEEMDPQPGPSGLGSPLPPAENPGKASSAPSCAPTEIIDPAGLQEEEVFFDQNSLDGEDIGDIDVGDDDDAMLVLPAKEKMGRGRHPTTEEHVGKREKEEEKARKRKEEEKERLAAESLKPTAPKGRKWSQLQGEEEELEARLAEAPTGDIASRLMERSITVLKIANRSNGLKGSLVKELQETAVMMRAATNIMAMRARGAQDGGDIERLSKQLEELRADNNRLRGEVERMKAHLSTPIPPPVASSSRKLRPNKRARWRIDSSESGGEE